MAKRSDGREARRWNDRPRAEKYALIQSEVLYWTLFAVALCLIATRVGVRTAVLLLAGGVLCLGAATIIGLRGGRNRTQ